MKNFVQENNLTFYIILHILLVDEENTILNAFSIQQLFFYNNSSSYLRRLK